MFSLRQNLSSPTHFSFEATTNRSYEGWAGRGSGKVTSFWHDDNTLIYEEEGVFVTQQQKTLKAKNTYCWRFEDLKVSLEHLRFGYEYPVFLFDLVQVDQMTWKSSCPHQCDLDQYHGTLILQEKGFKLNWLVQKGQEYNRMDYIYS